LTFFLDATKGVLAVLLATPVGCHLIAIFLGAEGGTSTFQLNETSIWAAGFFAILGHCFPPWLHFKGGKGIATTLGVTLVLSPIAALFGLLGFGITFWHKRIISLASLSGALVAAIAFLVLNPIEAYLWVGAAILFLILLRHEKNIDALLENKEKAFP
jgi:glycerol-3-phosphate acyltransferase PlsY